VLHLARPCRFFSTGLHQYFVLSHYFSFFSCAREGIPFLLAVPTATDVHLVRAPRGFFFLFNTFTPCSSSGGLFLLISDEHGPVARGSRFALCFDPVRAIPSDPILAAQTLHFYVFRPPPARRPLSACRPHLPSVWRLPMYSISVHPTLFFLFE